MRREVDIDEISDGKRYHANDMVKISCNDCRGCSKCCHDMGKSIVLDPYDIYMLEKALGKSFDELMGAGNDGEVADGAVIELSMVDGLLLPNIRMNIRNNSCSLLSEEGRCTVHNSRPGYCRLFPLGRLYNEDDFEYFNQIHECDYPTKSKIKVKKWIGIDNIAEYEKFILKWHDYMENLRKELQDMEDMNDVSRRMVEFLEEFYRKPFRMDVSFYEQINI